ncbi:hypothetical protein FGIG_12006, partial [Fasciola gigantica]
HSFPRLLSFHPKDPYLFSSALGDYTVAVWCTETGIKLNSLDGHQSTVTAIAFSADGKSIATVTNFIHWAIYQIYNVWCAFQSLEACVYLPRGALATYLGKDVTSSESGLLISGGQWGCLRVWNPINGRCELEIRGPLDRRPNALLQVTGDTGKISRESIEYGLHSVVDLQIIYVKQHEGYRTTLADDTGLVPKLVLVRQSNHVEFYDPATGKLFSEFLGDIGQVDQLCIVGKEKSRLVLADASTQLKIFVNPHGMATGNTGSWDCHLVPAGHTDVICDIAVSSCGEWMVSGSKDQSLCVWRVVEHDEMLQVSVKGPNVQVLLVATQLNAHAAHVSAVCFDK